LRGLVEKWDLLIVFVKTTSGPMEHTLEIMLAIHVVALWVVTPCNDVVVYQRFGGSCCLHIHSLQTEEGGSRVLRILHILHYYTVSQPSGPRDESSSLENLKSLNTNLRRK
jgi:hypothetical protein